MKYLRSIGASAYRMSRRVSGLNSWTGRLLWVAGCIGVAGLLLIVLVSPSPVASWGHPRWLWQPWPDLSLSDRIQVATGILTLLGLAAAVLTLGAGVAELHQVMPEQRLRITVFAQQSGEAIETHVIAANPTKSPIVNAYRIDVQLERQADSKPVQVPPPKRERTGLGGIRLGSEIVLPRLNAEPPEWRQHGEYTPNADERFTYWYGWTRERDERWFPGLLRHAPDARVPIVNGPYQWRVTWWTDRNGPLLVVLPVAVGRSLGA